MCFQKNFNKFLSNNLFLVIVFNDFLFCSKNRLLYNFQFQIPVIIYRKCECFGEGGDTTVIVLLPYPEAEKRLKLSLFPFNTIFFSPSFLLCKQYHLMKHWCLSVYTLYACICLLKKLPWLNFISPPLFFPPNSILYNPK